MVIRERSLARAMADHLVERLCEIPEARTLWVSHDCRETVLWLVTERFDFDPEIEDALYGAAVTLDDAFPFHAYRFHILNPEEYETADPEDLFRSTIWPDAIPFEIHPAV